MIWWFLAAFVLSFVLGMKCGRQREREALRQVLCDFLLSAPIEFQLAAHRELFRFRERMRQVVAKQGEATKP